MNYSRATLQPLALVLALMAAVAAQDPPAFPLSEPGTEDVVQYEKYGHYEGAGTTEFRYVIDDWQGLVTASGTGIDPCVSGFNKDAEYQKLSREGKLKQDPWKHVESDDARMDFYVWAAAGEDPGLKLLFKGVALEKGRHEMHAAKAYRAGMILYPQAMGKSSDGSFSWSAADACWNKLTNLLKKHPELGLELVQDNVEVRSEGNQLRVAVTPGVLRRREAGKEGAVAEKIDFSGLKKKVGFMKDSRGHWHMGVLGQGFFVKAVNYMPTPVGQGPNFDWMHADKNGNGLVDVEETYMDANGNNQRDADEPVLGDFALLKMMGCNAIKTYSDDFNLPLLRKAFQQHGVRVIVGEFLGAYTVHSGATWEEGTDYTNPAHLKNMKQAVRKKVLAIKDEPWLLLWQLGNENNMPDTFSGVNATRTNASRQPEAYARFLGEVCDMIHELDPDHPVGVGNLNTGLLEFYAKHALSLDYIGVNAYMGGDGLGSTWKRVKNVFDRPVLITEYGCDAYWSQRGPDEEAQRRYHKGCWEDITYHRGGGAGVGNAVGGVIFEWLDEWWKDTRDGRDPLDRHSVEPTIGMPFPDGFSQEEWLGIMGQGDGKGSPFLRQPRKAYYEYMNLWKL